jgi:hypothetical protein
MFRRAFLLLTLMGAPLTAQEETVPDTELPVPAAPGDHILDQAEKWPPGERAAAAAELNAAAVQLRLSVFLVNLKAAPEEQPADFARRLAYSWTGTADRAVILSGPGFDPPLLIEFAGESLGSVPAEQLRAVASMARAEAAKAQPGLPASLAAARSLIAQVNAYRGGAPLGGAGAGDASGLVNDERGPDFSILWLALGAISIVLLLAAAFFLKRRQTSARIFPRVPFRRRFSAPHSGGNDAMIQFTKPGTPPPPH